MSRLLLVVVYNTFHPDAQPSLLSYHQNGKIRDQVLYLQKHRKVSEYRLTTTYYHSMWLNQLVLIVALKSPDMEALNINFMHSNIILINNVTGSVIIYSVNS